MVSHKLSTPYSKSCAVLANHPAFEFGLRSLLREVNQYERKFTNANFSFRGGFSKKLHLDMRLRQCLWDVEGPSGRDGHPVAYAAGWLLAE